MKTLTIRKIEEKEHWQNFVSKNNGSVYHDWRWGQLLKKAYHYNVERLTAWKEKELIGILPIAERGQGKRRRWHSIPWADFGGPMSTNPDAAMQLIEAARRPKTLLILKEKPDSISSEWRLESPFCRFTLDVTIPFETILKTKYHQKTRNMVFKAERNGVKVQHMPLKKGFKKYYPMLYHTMIKLNTIPFDRNFLKILAELFDKSAHLFLAEKKGKILSGLITLEGEKTLFIWSNASTTEGLNIGANNAVYSEAIRYACNEPKLTEVDLGNTIQDTSHHFFKKRWGGQEHAVYALVEKGGSVLTKPPEKLLNLAIVLLKTIPWPLTQGLLKAVYRYY